MWQVVSILVVAAMAVVALKLAFAFLLIAGLIFRTKETVGFLFVAGVFALLRNYPVPGYTFLAIALLIAMARYWGKSDDDPPKLTG